MFDIEEHMLRLRTSVLAAYSLESVPEWITQHTTLRGEPFSFTDHEYQLRILQSDAPERVIKKCSQVGITELSIRMALAYCDILDNFSLIYTFPTSTFAENVSKTRIDPIIAGSRHLSGKLSPSVDNTSIKQIGTSFLYVKGTYGNNQAISIPADMVINDETDFSNSEAMSNFQSRLTHSRYKMKVKLSTPTVEKRGIAAEFAASRRHYNFVRCDHCGHSFIPSFLDHVRIPGFDGDILSLNRDTIHRVRHREAALHCPKCDLTPNLQPDYREWVCENPTENFTAEGFQISPFDAPNVISVPYLVEASTKYARKADFLNFNLGLTAEDNESGITDSDVHRMFESAPVGDFPFHVIGMDMGLTCHIMVAGVDPMGGVHVVHSETAHYSEAISRYRSLEVQYRVAAAVVDTQPYVETIYRLQQMSPLVYGSVYVKSKNLEMFTLKDHADDEQRGMLDVRQVNINRNFAFDALFEEIRQPGRVTIRLDKNRDTIAKHLVDMRRVKDLLARDSDSFSWVKSDDGNDHFHHALLYCFVASRLTSVPKSRLILPPMMTHFRVKSSTGLNG